MASVLMFLFFRNILYFTLIFFSCVCVLFKARKPTVMVRSSYNCREGKNTLRPKTFCNDAEPLFGFYERNPTVQLTTLLPPLVRGVEWWFQARLFLEQIQFAFALFLSALAVYGWCSTFQEVSGPQCRKGRGCLAGLIRRQLVLRGTWNS